MIIWITGLETYYADVHFMEIELTHEYVERSLNYLRDSLDNWQRYKDSFRDFPLRRVAVWADSSAILRMEGDDG